MQGCVMVETVPSNIRKLPFGRIPRRKSAWQKLRLSVQDRGIEFRKLFNYEEVWKLCPKSVLIKQGREYRHIFPQTSAIYYKI